MQKMAYNDLKKCKSIAQYIFVLFRYMRRESNMFDYELNPKLINMAHNSYHIFQVIDMKRLYFSRLFFDVLNPYIGCQ